MLFLNFAATKNHALEKLLHKASANKFLPTKFENIKYF